MRVFCASLTIAFTVGADIVNASRRRPPCRQSAKAVWSAIPLQHLRDDTGQGKAIFGVYRGDSGGDDGGDADADPESDLN